jgi:hypothetical protein
VNSIQDPEEIGEIITMTEITPNPAKDAMTAQTDFQSNKLQEAYDIVTAYGHKGVTSPDEQAFFKALNTQPLDPSAALPNLTIDRLVGADENNPHYLMVQTAFDTDPGMPVKDINVKTGKVEEPRMHSHAIEASADKDEDNGLHSRESSGDDDVRHKEHKMESSGSAEYCAEILKASGGHFTDDVRSFLRGGDIDTQIQAISNYLSESDGFHFKKDTYPQQGGLPPYIEVTTCKDNDRETVIDRMEIPPKR